MNDATEPPGSDSHVRMLAIEAMVRMWKRGDVDAHGALRAVAAYMQDAEWVETNTDAS